MPCLTHCWGNPSSDHAYGWPSAQIVSDARGAVAKLIGALPEEILFLSCGSEADNHAILGTVEAEERRLLASSLHSRALPHVVTTNIEHPAITACLEKLREDGRIDVTYVPADACGCVTAGDVSDAVQENTVLGELPAH